MRIFKPLLLSALGISSFMSSGAQETFPINGVRDERHTIYAFTNAIINTDSKTLLNNATLVIQDGLIKAVGVGIAIPQGAVITDLKGKYIYPAFVEPYGDYGMQEVKKGKGGEGPQMESNTPGAYNWNQAVKPEYEAYKFFSADEKKAEELRKLGYGAVNTFQKDGIFRGSSLCVALDGERTNDIILKDRVASCLSFDKGSSTQDYPSSLMGSIALIRQSYYDAQWYKNGKQKEYNISLDAINHNSSLVQFFDARDKYEILRADRIGDEFGIKYTVKSNGDEYQRIEELKQAGVALIVPLNFPQPFDVDDAYDALNTSLGEMKHWELAPGNPAALEKAGIGFSFTLSDLKEKKQLLKNIRKAIEYGLSPEMALRALTSNPAELLKISDKVGSLKSGMLANFLIVDKAIFEKDANLLENWCQGKKTVVADLSKPDLRGNWQLTIGTTAYKLEISGEAASPKYTTKQDTTKLKTQFSYDKGLVVLQVEGKDKQNIRLSGTADEKNMKGRGQMGDGSWTDWSAVWQSAAAEGKKDTTKQKPLEIGKLSYPLKAYGREKLPSAETVIFQNVTVWTNEKDGIMAGVDVVISGGRISSIGRSLPVPAGAKVIDGRGKHLTPGIIDEHSHIAISKGVNEGTQAVTSEVRIGDVVNSDDVNIYRQLSGGVTSSQLLHGSANPIGGQAQLIKLRWGKAPEAMKFENADGFIKFALGENVKQSNWGDRQTIRYPQTRMGVEQVMIDAFSRAKAYEKQQKAGQQPRKDLELDALVEILNKKRFITCHSYVQSEINMLMKAADSMGFTVNTFTHILEGYKVADKMKMHGANASTFADWWAYKYEVIDAIPYNAAIMTKVGLNTSINSDDAEMARRLNQEAGKIVKYGGVSEEEALKLVTLNPAKMLHVDNRVGSIRAGKDADLVLWSDHPLSIYAKAEKTFVDGVCYFDREEDKKLREDIRTERARLVKKMQEAKSKGEGTQKAETKWEERYDCEGAIID